MSWLSVGGGETQLEVGRRILMENGERNCETGDEDHVKSFPTSSSDPGYTE